MTVYKGRTRSPMVWIVAAVLFVLTMTITFSDVSGFTFPKLGHSHHQGMTVSPQSSVTQVQGYEQMKRFHPDPETPGAIPEPTTLLLMAAGLGLGAIKHFRKN